ncbi:TonB-dependent receptor plug domain-containing protein [Agaribacterium haliotis]|uniref:TonB-dependent receptor plug domain-containing protein n=1 Tax=Agaribacterium haliotis TaxID=2013869 RepID=UPI000BB59169|nr:TonB-dependent receptor [Agaribacterium haliotis]
MYRQLSFIALGLCTSAYVGADDKQSGETSNDSEASTLMEETLVMHRRRDGDYNFITEDTEKLVDTAGALGDPLSAVFALPGVVYGSGGQEPAVRGSSPADNAYVVDFLPATHIFHEFGVSVFSEFTLHSFDMYSAGFGPEYGNATGAIFDIKLRKPRQQELSTIIDFSMLRSGIFVESAVTENSAFYVNVRRSLLDVFVSAEDASDEDEGIVLKSVPQDQDYLIKYSWDINDYNNLSISANGAGDNAEAELTEEADFVASNPDFAGDAKLESGAQGQSIVWQRHDDNKRRFMLAAGNLEDEENLRWGDDYKQDINYSQQTLKAEFSQPINSALAYSIGGQYANNTVDYNVDQILFVCTEFDPDCDTSRRERITEKDSQNYIEQYYFANALWTPTDRFDFELGAQYQSNDYTNEDFVHPRLSASFALTDSTRLNARYGSYNRFPDLETVLPETGNPDLPSPTAQHYTLGVVQDFGEDWSLSVETYYKELENLPLALSEENDSDNQRYIADTSGKAYGVDIMLNKNLSDNWYSWVALSMAKSERTNGQTLTTQDYNLDTPLIFNWVMNWQATRSLNLGWRWSVRSGEAYTPIIGVQENPYFEDSVLPIYGEAYSDRLPNYNRLDLRMKWDFQSFGKDSALIVDIINALNHDNVDERNLDYDKVNQPGDKPVTIDTVGLGFTPALTYRLIL